MELAQAIQLAQNGQFNGFEAIFQHSADNAYFKAVALLENKGNPLVLVHDTYVSAFKSIHNLQSPSDFRVWLGEIFYSKILKHTQTDTLDYIEKNFDNKDTESIMNQFRFLPLEQKAILIFSYYDGCTAGQIGQIMNLDEVIVKRNVKSSRFEIENGIKSERNADIKINATAFTFAFCQAAKDEKIPSSLSSGIFHNVCIDSGILPHDTVPKKIVLQVDTQDLEISQPVEIEKCPETEKISKDASELPKLDAEENISVENKKKENKFSNSILGKIFKNI